MRMDLAMKKVIYFVLAILPLLGTQAFAEVRFIGGSILPFGKSYIRDYAHIEVVGQITDKDIAQLHSSIEQYYRHKYERFVNLLVFLNSSGGDVRTAIGIGKQLRERGALVYVDKYDECSSACVFVLAGGVKRTVIPGAVLGLHRPYFEKDLFAGLSAAKASKLYNSLIEICRNYLSDMGIRDVLFSDILAIPSHKVRYVDTEYAKTVGLHGTDPAYEEWERAKTERKIGKEKMRLRDLYLECINSGVEDTICYKKYGAGFQ